MPGSKSFSRHALRGDARQARNPALTPPAPCSCTAAQGKCLPPSLAPFSSLSARRKASWCGNWRRGVLAGGSSSRQCEACGGGCRTRRARGTSTGPTVAHARRSGCRPLPPSWRWTRRVAPPAHLLQRLPHRQHRRRVGQVSLLPVSHSECHRSLLCMSGVCLHSQALACLVRSADSPWSPPAGEAPWHPWPRLSTPTAQACPPRPWLRHSERRSGLPRRRQPPLAPCASRLRRLRRSKPHLTRLASPRHGHRVQGSACGVMQRRPLLARPGLTTCTPHVSCRRLRPSPLPRLHTVGGRTGQEGDPG